MSTLKEARTTRGLKQCVVAEHLGITRQTYSKYEKNPEKMTVDQAKAACDFIGCSVDEIFLSNEVSLTNKKGGDLDVGHVR